MHPNLVIAIRAARKAGDIIARSLHQLDNVTVTEKHHNDYVTDIDLKAEQAIIDILRTAFPNDSFLTEEQGEVWGQDRETIWVIDPLDGTLNFLHGFPHFAVSIARKVKGRVEQALIFNPVTQDLFTASRGEGAMLNERRMRVAKRAALHACLIAANFPRMGQNEVLQQNILKKIVPEIGAMRRTGSTALDLAYVAAGHLDGFICDHFHEWDIAAGMLLVREAGGMVTDHQGNDAGLNSQTLLASNPKLIRPLLASLQI